MSWTPVTVQAIISIAVMIAIGLAVLGQVRWRATQEWESLADARGKRVEALEQEMAALKVSHQQEVAFLNTRVQALEAQVAEVQKLNLTLQRQLTAQASPPPPRARSRKPPEP